MKKYLKIILLLAAAVFICSTYWPYKVKSSKIETPNEITSQPISASLSIDFEKRSDSFNVSSFIGKTALEATQVYAKVVTEGNGTNAFITSINSRVADSKKHEFWELLINNKPSSVGAGSYIIQNGDSILWHITTY